MVSVSAHSPQTYHFVPASSGSNFYYVGAEASGSDALPNSGVQATIQVVSQPVSDCLSYWVSDDLSNNMWGQVGYSICGGSTPWAFWEVWNLNTTSFVTQSFAPVTTGYHKFSMYLQSGTIWAYALDGQVFGTYDMEARVSSSSYPVYALSEEGYVSAPWNPVQVTFSVAIQVMQSGTWQYVQTASSFGNSWGLQGNLQDSSLADDEMAVGGNISPLASGTALWNNGTPDFTVMASPTNLSAPSGATATSTITVAPVKEFNGTVALAVTVAPDGLTCKLSPASVSLGAGASQTSTLSCYGSAAVYTVTVTGASGSKSRSAMITATIADYSVTASPTDIGADSGGYATSTVTVSPVDLFTGTVALDSTSSPAGLTCTFSSTSLDVGSAQTSTLTCTGTDPGSFTVIITGSSGSLTHTATITMNIRDFALFSSPASVAIPSGFTARFEMNIASVNGFTGTVILSSTVQPAGPSCSLSTTSIMLGASQNSTLLCQSLAAGDYIVNVTGTSGPLVHSVSVRYSSSQPRAFLLEVNTSTAGVLIVIDGVAWVSNASGLVALSMENGTHSILVPSTIPIKVGPMNMPSMIENVFITWQDGNTDNPRTLDINQDTVLTPTYRVRIETSFYETIVGAVAFFSLLAIAVHRVRRPTGQDHSKSRQRSATWFLEEDITPSGKILPTGGH